jgi:uncharacterized protein YndB with AHSA1/START domain
VTVTVDALSPHEPVIIMSRVFDASREKVWEAFTKPEHVARWYGGHGFTNPVCEMDVRPGGHWHHVMRTPDGTEFETHFVFVDVMKPEKLSWRDIDHGKRPPGGHPTCLVTVTLEDLGAKTKWRMVARFNSIAERDVAQLTGFAHVLAEGTERFNEVAKSI